MKIIERGELPQNRVHVETCRNCKSKLEFTQGECKHSPDPRDHNLWSVKCPVCNHDVWVSL